MLNLLKESLNTENKTTPLTVYISTNGGILFSSFGYKIGIGEDLEKIIKLEEETKVNSK
jgi:hypothetical protein